MVFHFLMINLYQGKTLYGGKDYNILLQSHGAFQGQLKLTVNVVTFYQGTSKLNFIHLNTFQSSVTPKALQICMGFDVLKARIKFLSRHPAFH